MTNINNKKQTTFINRCMEDPYTPSPRCLRTRPSPWRERGNKLPPSPAGEKVREAGMRGSYKGFTLIELLVVVLIIGILAAVALPQYQKAVLQSRFANIRKMMYTLKSANEAYYLEHGKYADNIQNLAVNFPCLQVQYPTAIKCDNDFIINIATYQTQALRAAYCPGHQGNWDFGDGCLYNADFIYTLGYDHTWRGFVECSSTTELGKNLCKSIK